MSKYFLFISLSLLCLMSCKESTQIDSVKDLKKSDRNIIVHHKKSSTITPSSLKKIETWQAYTAFNDFIKRFEKTSPDEAFDNVAELKELTLALEDSLNIVSFKNSAFKSRLHVLKNEVMRLEDMEDIPAITSKEVNLQVDKIFLVFTSLNNKINTVFNQEKFEKDIDLGDFFTMDKKELLEPKKPVKNKRKKKRRKKKK